MTPGGMNKDFGLLTKFPGMPKGGKKATTLFLMPTLLAKIARKLPKSKVSFDNISLTLHFVIVGIFHEENWQEAVQVA